MEKNPRLDIAICWQLQALRERDPTGGSDLQPWSLLRTIGVYTDMLAELEQATNAWAVLMLSPDLLEQVDKLALQIRHHIEHGKPLRQALLAALVNGTLPTDQSRALPATRATQSRRTPAGHSPGDATSAALAGYLRRQPELAQYRQEAAFDDLVAWHFLHWLGISVLRHDPRARRLAEQDGRFSREERLSLLAIIGEQLDALLPRLRDLARRGRVEPGLLSDSRRPDQIGGELRRLQSQLGRAPSGFWHVGHGAAEPPPDSGILWVGGNPVPRQRDLPAHSVHYYPRRDDRAGRACLRREELLSRMIEKSYPEWQTEDAVANCTWRLEDIARRCATRHGALVVLAIGDRGVWDRYPDRGAAFRRALYLRVASHPRLRLTTLDRALSASANGNPIN